MAYLSGNAIFIKGTKRADQPLESCSTAFFSQKDVYRDNFGFKVSDGGALSLVCAEEQDQQKADFKKSSSLSVDFTVLDEPVKTAIAISDNSVSFNPLFRSAHILDSIFERNHAGR